jgi:hypothetical protein
MKKRHDDFMPRTDADKLPWLYNMQQKLPLTGILLGLLPAQITELGDAIQQSLDAINQAEVKRAELSEACNAKQMLTDNQFLLIRRYIGIMKRSAQYNTAIGGQLNIIGSSVAIDTATVRPTLKLSVFAGNIHISYKKQFMPNICIYSRQRGSQAWHKIAQVNYSPFVDVRSLAEAGKPEAREYMALYHNGAIEVGQESDIATILTGTLVNI